MYTPLIFLGVLSILVLIHELGHFLAARYFGIKVEEFALGLPFTPPIFKIKKGETQYAIYPLLFGGFVKLHGEDLPAGRQGLDAGRSFWDRGKKQRMLVICAGVFMNVVLALVGFTILYAIVGLPVRESEKITIAAMSEDSPAKLAGVQLNDRITEVEGKKITNLEDFGNLMKSWGGLAVNLTVERGVTTALFEGLIERETSTSVITVTPRVSPPAGQGALGVRIVLYPYIQVAKCSVLSAQCSGNAVVEGFKAAGKWAYRVLDGLRSIGKSLAAGKAPEGVAGPVGIYQLTGMVAKEGVLPLLELMSVLSMNLAVFNILPIPALDGGRALFIWLEWVLKKRLSAQLEAKINSWGMAILLGLIALVTLQDVIKL